MANPAVIATVDIPQGKIFRFEKFGVDYDAAATASHITWTVKIGTTKLNSYEAFKYQPGALSDLEMNEVGINVKGPNKVTIEALNADSSAHFVYARIKGGFVEDT